MRLILAMLLTVISTSAFAIDEGDIRVGVIGGNNNLLGDVGDGGHNTLSTGAIFAYQLLDDIAFNVIYLTSKHEFIAVQKHTNLSLGVDYYTGGDGTIAYHLSGGACTISNSFTTSSFDGNAMCLYAGGGIDFQIQSNFLFGLKAKYNKAFETTGPTGAKNVQDSIDVFAAVEFVFGKK